MLKKLRHGGGRRCPHTVIAGQRNTVECPRVSGTASLVIAGDDNEIAIDPGATLGTLTVNISGNGNRLIVAEGVRLESLNLWVQGTGSTCIIGPGTYISSANLMLAESGTRIDIGSKCMIASGIEIRTGDSHGIFDLASRERINPGQDIRIGSNVWLTNGVLVLKGADIPDGSVVGARSVVTKPLEEKNAAYAGNPARLVRSNIIWSWHLDRLE